jgi:hypothetical protein
MRGALPRAARLHLQGRGSICQAERSPGSGAKPIRLRSWSSIAIPEGIAID